MEPLLTLLSMTGIGFSLRRILSTYSNSITSDERENSAYLKTSNRFINDIMKQINICFKNLQLMMLVITLLAIVTYLFYQDNLILESVVRLCFYFFSIFSIVHSLYGSWTGRTLNLFYIDVFIIITIIFQINFEIDKLINKEIINKNHERTHHFAYQLKFLDYIVSSILDLIETAISQVTNFLNSIIYFVLSFVVV